MPDLFFRRLSHPCIVTLYGLVQIKDQVGVVAEKADRDLAAYIRSKGTRLHDGAKKVTELSPSTNLDSIDIV